MMNENEFFEELLVGLRNIYEDPSLVSTDYVAERWILYRPKTSEHRLTLANIVIRPTYTSEGQQHALDVTFGFEIHRPLLKNRQHTSRDKTYGSTALPTESKKLLNVLA